MRIILILLLLTASCSAQSITISGGNGSILVSGRSAPAAVSTAQEADKAAPVPPRENASPVKPSPPSVSQPAKSETKPKRREWYLVSESWCKHCPAAKAVFLGKGWPEANVLTIAECEARFGFRPSHVPFEFGEPQQTQRATIPQPVVRQRLPVVNTQWGTIDLETYQRNCNCSMCQGIRALQQQYRGTSLPAAQQPTPDEVIDQTLELLRLTDQDVLADIGCGDGRVLISAARQYGCRGVGVEIDPAMAETARRRVAEAGMSDRITIVTGDAAGFGPAEHGVTAGFAYLYPETLASLKGVLTQIPRVGTPYHSIAGLPQTRHGDVFIFRRDS